MLSPYLRVTVICSCRDCTLLPSSRKWTSLRRTTVSSHTPVFFHAADDNYSTVDGYVLTPITVQQSKIHPELNPLLMPKKGGRDYLEWSMLSPPTECRHSSDPAHLSWTKQRCAPATWPRVTSLWLISRGCPGPIEVSAANKELGVLCEDVINAISKYLAGYLTTQQCKAAPKNNQDVLSETWYHNRELRVPDTPSSGSLPQYHRFDWMGTDTMYDGCETVDWIAEVLCGRPFPCVFELRTKQRKKPLTAEELTQQKQRMKHGERQAKERQLTEQRLAEQKLAERKLAEEKLAEQRLRERTST